MNRARRTSRWAGLGLGLALAMASTTAAAATLDWATNPWPDPATRSQVYTIGGGDVTVTIFDNDNVLVGTPDGNPAAPSTNTFLDTPLNGGDTNLFLRADGNSGPNYVTIRFEFAYVSGVTNVNFNLYDIDADLSQWRDLIVVSALAVGGGIIGPDSVSAAPGATPTWVYNAANRRIIGIPPNAGNANDDGTALVGFTSAIQGFQLTYVNAQAPYGNQWIGISDILFAIIPEPDPTVLLAAGFAALWLARRRLGAVRVPCRVATRYTRADR